MASISDNENLQVQEANASGHPPVVFVHGLWLLASSWQPWAELFAQAGYAPVSVAWPGDADTVEEARANPDTVAGKKLGEIAAHVAEVIGALDAKPVVVGHSFGGLLTQMIAARGLSAASVAIDPAPFRGVLALPLSTLRSAAPVLSNPANRRRAISLTYEQFRYGWANALAEPEARQLHQTFHVPGSGTPLFEGALANINPRTEAQLDTRSAERGPLLIISGEKDHTVPHAISHESFKRQRRNASLTEFAEIPNRGHSLTIDSGWREVADRALDFVKRQA